MKIVEIYLESKKVVLERKLPGRNSHKFTLHTDTAYIHAHILTHTHTHTAYILTYTRIYTKELISFLDRKDNQDNDSSKKSIIISIPISMAITAYARIHMSQYLNMPNYKVYYTDTDSVFLDKALPDNHIGQELGQMKLEGVYDEAIFIAPKVYGAKSINENQIFEYTKCKGAKNIISYYKLKSLLDGKNSHLQIEQEKWYRNMSHGSIQIKNEIYTIMKTENKRMLVYKESDKNSSPISTKPFVLSLEE